jgi:LysR family transcriptional regulator, nod-box dependent transcriptional activator
MDFRGLDLNLLVMLDVLLEEKNITRTGERIHLSQSATSGALSRLRYYFKDELLVQVGNRMVLTPLAEDLIKPIKDLLMQASLVAQKTSDFDPATSTRRFKIELSDYVATLLLPSVIRRVYQVAPSVQIELVGLTDAPNELLERGEVDFLILPEDYLTSSHPSAKMFVDEYACAVWKDNPEVGRKVSLEQYLEAGHVSILFGKQRSQSFDDMFLSRSGFTRRVEVVAMNYSLMPHLVIGTSRIATMHRKLAHYYTRHLPLRMLDMPISLPKIVETVQWHEYRDKDPAHRWFRSLLVSAGQELDAAVPSTQIVA